MSVFVCVLIKFDKLLLESHQVPTVVLLLDSPEDEVVIKATDAIYRFSEKCKCHPLEKYSFHLWLMYQFSHLLSTRNNSKSKSEKISLRRPLNLVSVRRSPQASVLVQHVQGRMHGFFISNAFVALFPQPDALLLTVFPFDRQLVDSQLQQAVSL